MAALQLPEGAVLSNVLCNVNDQSATAGHTMSFLLYAMTQAPAPMACSAPTPTANSTTVTAVTPTCSDPANADVASASMRAYFLVASITTETTLVTLYGCKVYFELSTLGG
jgi:hypothetical protein